MATGTSNVQSLAMIPEATFGSLVDNFPSTAIFDGSEYSIPILRGAVSTPGAPVLNEDNSVRRNAAGRYADVATTVSGGVRVQRRTGQLTFTIDALQAAGSAESGAGYWLTYLLSSSLVDAGEPGVSEVAVTGATASVLNVGTNFANYRVGDLVSTRLVGDRVEYAAIVNKTDATPDTLTVTPAFSATMAGENLHSLRTFGGHLNVAGDSVAFRVDGDKYRSYCFGCRMSSLKITANNTRVQAEFTFECAFIYDTHEAVTAGQNWLLEQNFTTAQVLHFLDSEVIVSNAIDVSDGGYPVIPGRISLDTEAVSVTLTVGLTPCPSPNSILAMSDMIVSDLMIEVSVTTCDIGTTFRRDLLDKVYRNLMVGMGPGGHGEGFAVFLPAAMLTVDPNLRDVGSPLVKQTLTWRDGNWNGDVGTRALTNLIDTPFRIGFGVGV